MPGPVTHSQDTRSIAIQTPLGKDALLLKSFRGDEGISRLFHFHLELLTTQPAIDFTKVVGKGATIGLRMADGHDRYFNGIVSSLSAVGGEGSFSVYRAELVPWTWLLTRTTDCRVFQNMTVPAIVEKVFGDLGFQDFQSRLQKVYPPREYCVQYRETDFNFVSRLLEQAGIFYFFEHQNGKHTFVMADAATEHKPFPGLEKARYRGMKEDQYEEDVITSWAIDVELRPSKYTLGAYNFETPNVNLTVQVESPQASEGGPRYEVYDFPGGYQKRPDGEEIVRVRIEEQESQITTVRGTGTCRLLSSGCRFDLIDHPQQDVNQPYVVTSITHQASEPSYVAGRKETGGDKGLYRNTFTAVPLKVPFRPRRVTPRPIVHGVQTAVVVGKKGEELWVDKHGRIKVQFFWDREGKRDENSSCWVRVAQNWAGKRWGAMFLPRIGQEVIVSFLEGDPDAPLVTGRVYNGEQMPPYELPAEQTKSTLKTSTSKGGAGFNELRFDDKAGAEQLFVHGQRDLDWVIERQSRELVGEESHIIIRGSRIEQVDKEQHLKVTGDLVEEVGGARFAAADKGLFLRAGSKIVVETGGEITLKAAGGFITIGAGGIAIQGTLVNINSGGAAGAAPAKAVRAPNKAASGAAGDASGPGGETVEDVPAAAADPVLLYREALEKNREKMSEADRKAYEQALKELELARNRKDQAGMLAAKAKLDAILQKNGIPIPTGTEAAIAAAAGSGGGSVVAPGVKAEPLVRRGLHLGLPNGEIWKCRGFTAFNAPKLWPTDRQKVIDYFGQWRDKGGNCGRVFARWNNTGYQPDYDQIEEMSLELGKLGMSISMVFSCDQVPGSSVLLPLAQLHDSVRRLAEVGRRVGNWIGECSNEDFKNGRVSGSFDPSWFTGIPMTRSTWYLASDEDPETPGPWMDWVTIHPGGDDEWSWEGPKVCYEAQSGGLGKYPPARRPTLIGEPRRIAEGTTPRQWADHAYHAEGFGCGSVVHGGFSSFPPARHHQSDLQNCTFPSSGDALSCIEAVSQVWKSGLIDPRESEVGRYKRASVRAEPPYPQSDSECPIVHFDKYIDDSDRGQHYIDERGAGRSYFREMPSGQMRGGAIDPGKNWKLETRLGYRLVEQGGYTGDGRGGNILILER